MSTETTAAAPEVTQAAPVAPSAPVTQNPNPSPAPAAPEPAAQAPAEFTFESTGYANADYALSVIGKAGIGPDHPAAQAAYDGDFSQLKHQLAAKGVAGADALVDMLQAAYSEHSSKAAQQAEATTKAVYDMAGGQDQWEQVASWARENADEQEKAALNELFDDPVKYKIAATYLLTMYDRAQGPREATASVVGGTGAPAVRSGGGDNTPITRAQFAEQARALYQKYGDGYVESQEYQALGRRVR